MATSPCNMCGSGRIIKTIQPAPEAVKAVALAICRKCDVRQCGKCDSHIQSPTQRYCRCGRDLFVP